MSEVTRRSVVVAAVLAAVVAGLVVDHAVARTASPSSSQAAVAVAAVPAAGAESSAWYCAGGGAVAPATVVLANPTGRAVSGTVNGVGTDGPGRTVPVTVPARGVVSVAATALVPTGWAAVTVSLDGGGVAVSQSVASPAGWSTAPCASSAAPAWYFAHGDTASGASTVISLFNPSATTATADVDLVSATAGYLQPPAFQELSVAPRSLVTVDVGDHDLDDPSVAVEVTALAGSLVADELELSPASGAEGTALLLGTAVPASRWCFAQTTDVAGAGERFVVLNPSGRAARVRVTFSLAGATSSPLTVSVGGQSTATVSAGGQTRLPAAVPYATCLQASGGTGVVVARSVQAPSDAPVPEVGEAPGQSEAATRWLVSPVPAPGTGLWTLAVAATGTAPVRVTVRSLAGGAATVVPTALDRAVSPGAPLVLGPASPPPGTMLLVSATGPVTVEADAVPAGVPGVVVVPAYPLGAPRA